MKPKLKRHSDGWICGGLKSPPWYVDWFFGRTPEEAYHNWNVGYNRK